MYYEQEEIWGAVPVSQTRAAAAEACGLTGFKGGICMQRLYRCGQDLQHWFVFEDSVGWLKFPARIDGWRERQPVQYVHGLDLREVPLRLSFNTGLGDAGARHRVRLAA